jgi:hypothetical protein
VIFMIMRLVTLSVNIFLMSLSLRPDEREFISNLKKISRDSSLNLFLNEFTKERSGK